MELKIDSDNTLLKYVEFHSKVGDPGDYNGVCLSVRPNEQSFNGRFVVALFARTTDMDTLSTYEGRYYDNLQDAQDDFDKEVKIYESKDYKIHQKSF